mmetsp:Transcript_11432/g.36148  ORF Transcript_11432/g.36148 Transcript_11432/m.36148 type:complete len:214 (+) Transcript_11432:197-838(+)
MATPTSARASPTRAWTLVTATITTIISIGATTSSPLQSQPSSTRHGACASASASCSTRATSPTRVRRTASSPSGDTRTGSPAGRGHRASRWAVASPTVTVAIRRVLPNRSTLTTGCSCSATRSATTRCATGAARRSQRRSLPRRRTGRCRRARTCTRTSCARRRCSASCGRTSRNIRPGLAARHTWCTEFKWSRSRQPLNSTCSAVSSTSRSR